MSFYYVIVIANHHWLDVWFCCSCCYSPVSLVLLWWLSTWEWTRSIKLHLTIVVKLQVARYPIIGPMAQSSTGSKAFEVEDDADVEIAGCSGCAEPLRWRAGTEFMNESACLKIACDTRSVSSNMLSLSQYLISAFVTRSPANGWCYLSFFLKPLPPAEDFRTGSGSLLETQVATRLWCEKCKQSRFIVLWVGMLKTQKPILTWHVILHAEKSIQKNTGALESKLELHQLSAEASATSAQLAARTGWSQRTEVA